MAGWMKHFLMVLRSLSFRLTVPPPLLALPSCCCLAASVCLPCPLASSAGIPSLSFDLQRLVPHRLAESTSALNSTAIASYQAIKQACTSRASAHSNPGQRGRQQKEEAGQLEEAKQRDAPCSAPSQSPATMQHSATFRSIAGHVAIQQAKKCWHDTMIRGVPHVCLPRGCFTALLSCLLLFCSVSCLGVCFASLHPPAVNSNTFTV